MSRACERGAREGGRMGRTCDLRWVGQEEPYGCGVAALAMIVGKTYADVKAWFGIPFSETGADCSLLDNYLTRHGFAVARISRWLDSDQWPPAPFGKVHLCHIQTSLRAPEGHFVAMTANGTVLDPATPERKRLTDYFKVINVAAVVPFKGAPE